MLNYKYIGNLYGSIIDRDIDNKRYIYLGELL